MPYYETYLGIERKVIVFDDALNDEFWIEGMGSSLGFFEVGQSMTDNYPFFICYEQHGMTHYFAEGTGPCSLVSSAIENHCDSVQLVQNANFGDGTCRTNILLDENDEYFYNDIPGSAGIFRAQEVISTTGNIAIEATDPPILFFAGKHVLLNAGFEVLPGGELQIEIDQCQAGAKPGN